MIQTQENGKKSFILGLILDHWAQIRAAKWFFFFFFFKIWVRKSLDILVSYHHVEYQKKTNDPLQKMNLAMDGKTDGGADGRMRVIS